MNFICKEECSIYESAHKDKGWALFTCVLVLLMPKCAFCWAAYMSLFTSAGVLITYQPWFFHVSLALFLVTLIKLLILAFRRKKFLSFGLAMLAGLLIISQRSVPGVTSIKILAILLMTIVIMTDNFVVMYKKLKWHVLKAGDKQI